MNNLPDVLLENIFQWINLKDVFTCACVCLHWKEIINRKIFWKRLLYKYFDVKASEKKLKSSILNQWKKGCFAPYGTEDPHYVFEPFPSVLGCGVVTPHGFKVDSNYKDFVVALEKLRILSMRVEQFRCVATFRGSNADGILNTIIIPWKSDTMPSDAELLSTLNINPKLLSSGESSTSDILTNGQLADSFHMNNLDILNKGYGELDCPKFCKDDVSGDDDYDNIEILVKEVRFQKWLKNIFRPSHQLIFGVEQLNPRLYFHLTKLSPGYVGGLISGLLYRDYSF